MGVADCDWCTVTIGFSDATRQHGVQAAGEFATGSMAPKVDAAIRFLAGGGQRAVIARLDDAEAALHGDAGTRIVAE